MNRILASSINSSGLSLACATPLPAQNIIQVAPKKPQIMLVDDDPLALLAVSSMLKHLQCEVLTAPNGLVALEEVKRINRPEATDSVQLMLMDANMPVMSGYDSARQITSMVREGKILPLKIVCLSAQDSGEHAELCKSSGMDYVIEKPCSIRTLREVLKMHGLCQ